MTQIIDELVTSFEDTNTKLEALTKSLESLSEAEKIMEDQGAQLSDAVSSLTTTSNDHKKFISEASKINTNFGSVIKVLSKLEPEKINDKLDTVLLLSDQIEKTSVKLDRRYTELSSLISEKTKYSFLSVFLLAVILLIQCYGIFLK